MLFTSTIRTSSASPRGRGQPTFGQRRRRRRLQLDGKRLELGFLRLGTLPVRRPAALLLGQGFSAPGLGCTRLCVLFLDGGKRRAQASGEQPGRRRGPFRRRLSPGGLGGKVASGCCGQGRRLGRCACRDCCLRRGILGGGGSSQSDEAADWRVPASARPCTSASVFCACFTSSAAAVAVASGVAAVFSAQSRRPAPGRSRSCRPGLFRSPFSRRPVRPRRISRPGPTRRSPSRRRSGLRRAGQPVPSAALRVTFASSTAAALAFCI